MCEGSLEDFFVNNKKYYKGRSWCKYYEREISHQVAQGLAHLHHLEIVHGSMKPSNILIASSEIGLANSVRPVVKLADFGLCKIFKTNLKRDSSWIAPEILSNNTNETVSFSYDADIWTLGLIFGYTLSGGKFIPSINTDEQIRQLRAHKNNLKKPYSTSQSAAAYQLIECMLDVDPVFDRK